MVAEAAAVDERARTTALDPRRSFIVQAPAGSGKTELLIRRYLTLLATVEEPEQIIAITFTRKAAAEMRQRVAAALRAAAAHGTPARVSESLCTGSIRVRCGANADPKAGARTADSSAPPSPHAAETLGLARAVLARDAERDWKLLDYPQRMRIETLDALNAWLARRLPVMASGVGGAGVVEDAEALYREAARRTLGELEGQGEIAASLRTLLGHCDNDVMRLESLLAELLPRREQWLPYFAGAEEAELRRLLEAALRRLVDEELASAEALLSDRLRAALEPLLKHAAQHAADGHREAFAAFRERPFFEGADRLAAWQGVAHLLLTRQDGWRRRLDRTLGFGPKHAAQRERLAQLLAGLEGDDSLLDALAFVRRLPAPRYSDAQWRTLAALRAALVHAAAELRVVFAERQAVDFVELALAAQQALGRADRPSDLLLALDRRIRHLLVDEFQDTSHAQLRLLELLTAGWQPGDGRTLFLVGDPMQSIYRFRNADVSLFLRVKRFGVGTVSCEPLSLERNFRSLPGVVDWINETFARAFPPEDDLGAGAAKFAACIASREPVQEDAVHVHALKTDEVDEELAAAADVIECERARAPAHSIGVLVQSRTHLAGLHAHLRKRGLAVHAVEIDPLNEHPLVQDLLGLTRALIHPADRIAWLALLRAPWCGMSWQDLAALCGDDHELTLIELMAAPERLERLSADGRRRLERLRGKLAGAEENRARFPFAAWIEHVWRALDGPASLDAPDEQVYAREYFARLERIARRGDLDDPAALEEAFTKPAAGAESPANTAVEIMTIHRAKGLEFDTVILLGLGREPRREPRKALHFMQRVARDGAEDLIIAPLPRLGEDDALCNFVARAEGSREQAERTRLLYVAATRARERLHLVCRIRPDRDEPAPRTLLSRFWTQVEGRFEGVSEPEAREARAAAERFRPVLRRFADGFEADGVESEHTRPSRSRRPAFEWAGQPAIQVGTLVHAYLHRIAESGLEAWSSTRVSASRELFVRELAVLGLDAEELEPAAERVAEALCGVLGDVRGRWLLESHPEARSELRLSLRGGAALEHVQLDRTFVAEGVRWIVDFKTSAHEGGNIETFLDSEVQRYRAQLERYARTMAAIDPRPQRVGLYFPLLRAFRSWCPECKRNA